MSALNPKSEARNSKQIRISKEQKGSKLLQPGEFRAFGFRIWNLFRISDFGFRVCGFAFLWVSAMSSPAATNLIDPDDIPLLRPPRGELAPTYWEQHGAWPVVLGGVGVLVVAAVVWLLLRPRPSVPVPPVIAAHQALDPLANQPENGVILSRISQVVRRYFSAAFALPPGELTTAEFSRELEGRQQVGAALSTAVNAFLRECDRRKFAPSPPPTPLGAAGLAARLIDQAEARRAASEEAANEQKS
jgi:hypothetical protein